MPTGAGRSFFMEDSEQMVIEEEVNCIWATTVVNTGIKGTRDSLIAKISDISKCDGMEYLNSAACGKGNEQQTQTHQTCHNLVLL